MIAYLVGPDLAARVAAPGRPVVSVAYLLDGPSPPHVGNDDAAIGRAHVRLACDLLAMTELEMSEVARRSGLGDGKGLATVFRRELGVTPTEYRERQRARIGS